MTKEKYQLYELFQFYDGNDDILGDMPPQDAIDTRQGMWAQMPYSVSDGQGVINEKFIDFVSNREYYPSRPLTVMPYLMECFNECVDNLKEVLNHTKEPKRFYNNLLKLQEYLIEQNGYDREPLSILNENETEGESDMPSVRNSISTLDDEQYAADLARAITEKLGMPAPQKSLGSGSKGAAFELGNDVVMKITSDVSEADAAFKTMRNKPQTIADMYEVYKVVDTEKNLAFFVLLQENIQDKPLKLFWQYHDFIDKIKPNGMDMGDVFILINRRGDKLLRNMELVKDLPQHVLTDNPEAGVDDAARKKSSEFLAGILAIKTDLINNNINSNDYSRYENLGYKDGILTYFDVGDYRADEPDVGDNVIYLPEGQEGLTEEYDKETADKIANQVAAQKGLGQPVYMRGGRNGIAYNIGNDKVLKITKDKSEAVENLSLIGKKLKYVAEIFNVFEVTSKSHKIPPTYAIVLEKLETNPEIRRQFDRLEYAFNKIMGVEIPDVIEYYLGEWDDGKVDKNKINSYLKRNPRDAEFFGGLLRIMEETKAQGIESIDYLNPDNLGYKKNGALAFFDVGSGTDYVEPQGAEKVMVDEDGSAKFSTPDAIGQDGFPPYDNTADSSQPIRNNLDANSSMYNEDLEYNHVVGDATEDEFMLTEVVKGGEYQAYHGSKTKIDKFSDEFVGAEEATDQEGPGIYFSTNIEDARAYGKYIHSVILRPRKFVDESSHKNVNRNEIIAFIKTAPDWEDTAQNWAENPKTGLYTAVNSFMEYAENEKDLYQQVWYDFFRYHPLEYVRGMVKLGYDGQIINKAEGNKHFIVYNPDIIEVTGVEDMSSEINEDDNNQLSEEFLGTFEGREGMEVFKNPNSIKRLRPDIRGIVTENGDLYIIDNSGDVIHNQLSQWLNFKGYPLPNDVYSGFMHGAIVTVQRYENTDKFYLGETISPPTLERNYDKYVSMLKLAKEKNPTIVFVMENIMDAPDTEINGDAMIIERDKSYGKGSQTVTVKKKCQLGGNGDGTSTACNQGDINNLEFGSIKEEIDASEALSGDEDALQTVLDGKRGVALIGFGSTPIMRTMVDGEYHKQRAISAGLNLIPIKQSEESHEGLDMNIVYRAGYEKQANRLYEIMMSHGGYVADKTPEEAREIGKLLGYTDESIEKYVRRIYPETLAPVEPSPDDFDENLEVRENFSNLASMNENNDYENEFPVITGNEVSGLSIRDGVPNMSSIDASLIDYKILDGIREVSFSKSFPDYPLEPKSYSQQENDRVLDLAEQIKNNKEITPLIVVIEKEGAYVLEGGHRFDALRLLGINEFPAKVVLDLESLNNETEMINETEIMSIQELPFRKEVEQLGGKIYSVGGAVRDEFLGLDSKDLDVLVTGIPLDELEQILAKYGRVSLEGKAKAILIFKPEGATETMDIAIPRTETPTGGGGHGDFDVQGDHELPLEKDLERRDITINAMAKDMEGNIIDPYGGQEDLKNKIIRAVNPDAFNDDPLRMVRAVQFGSRFGGFQIEPKTMQMIKDTASAIKKIAPERILIEFDKIITKGNPRVGVELLASTGLFKQIFGNQILPSQIGRRNFEGVKTMAEFLFLMMDGVVQNPAEFFLHRFGTKEAKKTKIYKEIQALDHAFNSDLLDQQMSPVKARSIASNMFKIAPQTLESQVLPEIIEKAAQELLQGKYPKTVDELAANGNDLMEIGLQGGAVGDMKKSLLINIYADKVRNNKEELVALAKQNAPIVKEYDNYPSPTLNEEVMKNIAYSAVVLTDESHGKLLKVFGSMIPEGWKPYAHHMTLNMGVIDPKYADKLGQEVELTVVDYAIDDLVMAVGVKGFPTNNAKPHITLAVNIDGGGKPFFSNKLTDWKPIGFPLKVTGIITEVPR